MTAVAFNTMPRLVLTALTTNETVDDAVMLPPMILIASTLRLADVDSVAVPLKSTLLLAVSVLSVLRSALPPLTLIPSTVNPDQYVCVGLSQVFMSCHAVPPSLYSRVAEALIVRSATTDIDAVDVSVVSLLRVTSPDNVADNTPLILAVAFLVLTPSTVSVPALACKTIPSLVLTASTVSVAVDVRVASAECKIPAVADSVAVELRLASPKSVTPVT